jgi:hypothetical protein
MSYVLVILYINYFSEKLGFLVSNSVFVLSFHLLILLWGLGYGYDTNRFFRIAWKWGFLKKASSRSNLIQAENQAIESNSV